MGDAVAIGRVANLHVSLAGRRPDFTRTGTLALLLDASQRFAEHKDENFSEKSDLSNPSAFATYQDGIWRMICGAKKEEKR